MPNIDLSILNQRQTPAFYASSLATRPAFGFAGRIFIDTDSPSTGLYRDTGAAWVQIADPGAGTTGTLQQVTTNGNTTSQGISITAGGLSSNIVTLIANGLSSTANYIGQTMATNDNWKIYGTGSTLDKGEMVFQVGDNGEPYAGIGQRFRFSYDATPGFGTSKDVFIVDYDLSYFNTSLGVNTSTPTADFDVHSGVSVIAQLNQTVATNNSLLAFQNSGTGLWRIGNFYNAGANDWGIFDVVGAIQPVTVKKTTGQVLIGTSTVGSGKLVVASSTGDNGVQIVGATAPSLRIDNAESGPTKRAALGISTGANNFIQGSVDGDFCILNGSSTASPILFGVSLTTNVQEAARFSSARNFLIGKTTDSGEKLQVNGTISSTLITTSANNIFNNTSGRAIDATSDGVLFAKNGGSHNIIFGDGNVRYYSLFTPSGAAYGSIRNFSTSLDILAFTPGGNVLIGTTTDAGYKFQVNGNVFSSVLSGNGTFYIDNKSLTNKSWTLIPLTNAGETDLLFFYTGTGASTKMTIKNTGVLNLSAVPTSAAGLVSGDIYSNLGVLTIVP